MIIQIIRQLDFNLAYAKKLVEDLSDEQMTVTPCIGFENHPSMDEKSLTEKIQWRFNNYFHAAKDLYCCSTSIQIFYLINPCFLKSVSKLR